MPRGGEQVPPTDPMKRVSYLMNFRMASQGIHNEVEDLDFASVSDSGDDFFSTSTAVLAKAIARNCNRREVRQPSERNKQSQSSKCRRRESREELKKVIKSLRSNRSRGFRIVGIPRCSLRKRERPGDRQSHKKSNCQHQQLLLQAVKRTSRLTQP